MGSTNPSVVHPSLKTTFVGVNHLEGILSESVNQYRGIKYGIVPARFRRSIINETFPSSYDATKHGPACPQPPIPLIEDIFSGISLELSKSSGLVIEEKYDEFECLNLVVTSPAGVEPDAKLPVMVYIHGGGSKVGGNAKWLYDGGNLVSRSVTLKKSVVMVSLNYRLGGFGFLASDELRIDNEKAGDKGVGNYGPYDQWLGINWVHRHIAPFGGDPSNITIFGESAGAYAIDSLIHSSYPARYQRAILQSGTVDAPVLSHVTTLAEENLKYAMLTAATKTQTVDELRAVPTMEFMALWFANEAGNHIADVPHWTLDDDWFHKNLNERINSPESGKLEIMIGECAHEHLLFAVILQTKPKLEQTTSFKAAYAEMESSLQPGKAAEILGAYGIQPESAVEDIIPGLLAVVGDVGCWRPIHERARLATEKGHKVYRYVFEETTPFGGPFDGKSPHSLDLAYLFTNARLFNDVPHPDWEREIQRDMQEKWITFANGQQPWRPQSEGAYYSFGPEGKVGEISQEELEKRRRVQKWKVFDKLSKDELRTFGVACNKAFAELSGHHL